MTLSALRGVVIFEDDDVALSDLRQLLGRFNGFTILEDIQSSEYVAASLLSQILEALDRVSALIDLPHAWRFFHDISSNPPVVEALMSIDEAYRLPRWVPDGQCFGALPRELATPTQRLAQQRTSFDFSILPPMSPSKSFEAALSLAADTYRVRPDGRRPIASGGAMWPLTFSVVGHGGMSLRACVLDHDRGNTWDVGDIDIAQWRQIFIQDPAVDTAISQGAATVIIGAHPTREIGKYGNRGWRNILMEAGAANHHISLLATERQVLTRPIAGFFDRELRSILRQSFVPLLVVLVLAPD